MALLNGQSPEEKAAEIIADAFEDKMVLVAGTAFQQLQTVCRYLNREKIAARGQIWYQKNEDNLITDTVTTLIENREKAITAYTNKKENDDKRKGFLELLARGIVYKEAVTQSGYNPDKDNENLGKVMAQQTNSK